MGVAPVVLHERGDEESTAVMTSSSGPVKRTRASKPKVKTGCLTCKIRRVKCGEERPACVRCTSTGRTCDGYDKGTPSRLRTQEPNRAELARIEFLKAYQWNEALRCLRPLAADIEGTDFEKRCFHRFRTAVTDGWRTAHNCNLTPFWSHVVPQLSHRDDAVKHAVVALGSAYQLFHRPDESNPMGLTRNDLELFTIWQYNKAIAKLKGHVSSQGPEGMKMTLVCCIAFICLETLRLDHEAAIIHMVNGLQIIESLPASEFDFLTGPLAWNDPTASGSEMKDLIRLFAHIEPTACFFSPNLRPIISQRIYASARFDDGTAEPEFADHLALHSAKYSFVRACVARIYETARHAGDVVFWSDPVQQRQQACLRARSRRLGELMSRFIDGPNMPPRDTPEWFGVYQDMLVHRCMQVLVDSMEVQREANPSCPGASILPPADSTAHYRVRPHIHPQYLRNTPDVVVSHRGAAVYREITDTATMLHDSVIGRSLRARRGRRLYSADCGGVIGALFLVTLNAGDGALRARAARLLAETGIRETFWDGPHLERLLRQVGILSGRCDGGDVLSQLVGLAAVPKIIDALERLKISD